MDQPLLTTGKRAVCPVPLVVARIPSYSVACKASVEQGQHPAEEFANLCLMDAVVV